MPKCVVVDPAMTWGDDRRPRSKRSDGILYEAHVRGMTAARQDIPEQFRGTFAGMADPRVIDHLVKLGVTAVELMPIQAFFDDRYLVENGLTNYWGYNTVNYFALAQRYISPGGDRTEFNVLVRRLHEAGIEVILDVVYNHTAEGNELGPTLSFRGIDNASYYLLAQDKRFYFDTTGCGNTVNLRHPRVLQMVMDSLRYWIEVCHVDGFRFDLATSLGREYETFDPNAVFLDAVRQDPVLSRAKLIAEPWDIGPNGYQVGRFPPGWSEWNGRYRDDVRSFWRGDSSMLPALARGLLGSSDLFEHRGRKPWASLNFVTAHDGFTLADLVAYNRKHNEANLEGNRDGHDDNRSWNCGVEGPTKDPAILDLRDRMRRNLVATLLLSQGTRCCSWRRGRTVAGRQQQRVLPGQPHRLAGLGRRRRARCGLHGVLSKVWCGCGASTRCSGRSGFCTDRPSTAVRFATSSGTGRTGAKWTRNPGSIRSPASSAFCWRTHPATGSCLVASAYDGAISFALPGKDVAPSCVSWPIPRPA